MGTIPDQVDIYFFAVQINPIDPASLLAIFPLNAPPKACVALAFSSDGVTWSSPVNLLDATSSFRTSQRDKPKGAASQEDFEFRSADHPAAGVVRSPYDASLLYVHIHHAVMGTSMLQATVGKRGANKVYHRLGGEAALLPVLPGDGRGGALCCRPAGMRATDDHSPQIN